jgi:XTP/dITP diphosphohydrolase
MTSSNSKILIATGNRGKFTEISALLNKVGIECVGAFDYDLEEPVEDGVDFQENSLIKAKYYAKATGLVSLADDSGLCVDKLGGEPGIHSARWAVNEETGKRDFNLAFERIVDALKVESVDLGKDEVKAHFICNLTIFNPGSNEHYSFEGRVDGDLTFPAKGEKGFGYDPIFISNIFGDKTFGEVSGDEKEKVSHRANAFAKFSKFLQSSESKKFLI